jgi:hypothetical protein
VWALCVAPGTSLIPPFSPAFSYIVLVQGIPALSLLPAHLPHIDVPPLLVDQQAPQDVVGRGGGPDLAVTAGGLWRRGGKDMYKAWPFHT